MRGTVLNYSAKFDSGLTYKGFLERYGSLDQKSRWDGFHASIKLTPAQVELLGGFVREMKILVLAGTWCGDCVNQCPIFERFAEQSPKIRIHYFDRDENPDLASEVQTCGAARVPTVVFLSEDGHVCGRYGDRTLSKYRSVAQSTVGAACSTGLNVDDDLTAAVVQDWLNEFERIQLMLRTSARLRKVHGD
jgi:thiol-disulfide isomerase/thioredoxin